MIQRGDGLLEHPLAEGETRIDEVHAQAPIAVVRRLDLQALLVLGEPVRPVLARAWRERGSGRGRGQELVEEGVEVGVGGAGELGEETEGVREVERVELEQVEQVRDEIEIALLCRLEAKSLWKAELSAADERSEPSTLTSRINLVYSSVKVVTNSSLTPCNVSNPALRHLSIEPNSNPASPHPAATST